MLRLTRSRAERSLTGLVNLEGEKMNDSQTDRPAAPLEELNTNTLGIGISAITANATMKAYSTTATYRSYTLSHGIIESLLGTGDGGVEPKRMKNQFSAVEMEKEGEKGETHQARVMG
jgi:hypothetical protein